MFTPYGISQHSFVLHDTTAFLASQSECSLAKAVCQVLASPYRRSLRKALSRLEAIAGGRVEGRKVSLRQVLRLEALLELHQAYEDTNDLLRQLMHEDGQRVDQTVIETIRYMQTTEWLSDTIRSGHIIDQKLIREIHSRCLYGPANKNELPYRQNEYESVRETAASALYRAPSPNQIPSLVEDLCAFVNSEKLTCISQSSIAHFQFEAIKAYPDGMDRTGRMLSHIIFTKRGLSESLILPLALGPAMNIESYAELLLPYCVDGNLERYGIQAMLENLIVFCVFATDAATKSITLYHEMLQELSKNWRLRLKKVERGSALDMLLYELPGTPLLTVAQAAKLIGRSFSATNSALGKLEEAGIVKATKSIGRKTTYEATSAIHAFESVEQKIIAKDPIDRDTLLAQIHVA